MVDMATRGAVLTTDPEPQLPLSATVMEDTSVTMEDFQDIGTIISKYSAWKQLEPGCLFRSL